ncbi:Putative uncharacterized protein FLJ37770 [Eumeta japonica]|uniref:Mos1 transposase HTH domain-containing protein n=1 Tax=Eumeta variegata TaxID=151549 RepID=A0A4C1T438_EUMVA|nr:Putative uncharacterized protein FLJ37770 [Eumeta japonica]
MAATHVDMLFVVFKCEVKSEEDCFTYILITSIKKHKCIYTDSSKNSLHPLLPDTCDGSSSSFVFEQEGTRKCSLWGTEVFLDVLQESAPSYTMVKKWARLFQQGRESCEDDPRPGRPVTVVTEENVRKIEKLVLADRRIKLWQIAEELQIS